MALVNAKLILKSASGLSVLKLLLLTARFSRPGLRPFWTTLLRPFVRNDEIPIQYRQATHSFNVFLRMADQESDLHSMLEVAVRNVYHLDPSFAPDLVIDGGANIGLFSLQAAAVYPSANLIVCEPLPRNVTQVEKHLSCNQITADLLPICIGGARRTIPFYCRGANASSFDPAKPFERVLDIDVLSLNDIVNTRPAQRILIKLDIEGMEIEALESYVPGEHRAVVILGELHGHKQNRAALERLFAGHGWSLQLGDLRGDDTIFEALSPAAAALGQQPDAGIRATEASSSQFPYLTEHP
jgi:FkbM family methyltransferase